MPMYLLGIFLYAFSIITGVLIMDTDDMTAKQMEIQRLIDNANHNASFALVEELKRQGVIEIDMPTALTRFHDRMNKNGGYTWDGTKYIPSTSSITKSPVYSAFQYIDFLQWQNSYNISCKFDGNQLTIQAVTLISSSGSRLNVSITDQQGQTYQLVPKILNGPSIIAVAMAKESGITPKTGEQIIPTISVQEVKY